jgi:hypothetical protein
VGATDICHIFHGVDFEHVLQSHIIGLKDVWAMFIALAILGFLASLLGEEKSLLKRARTAPLIEREGPNNEMGEEV